MTESRHDVTPVDDVYTVPASYAQERVWFTAQLSPGQPLFTMTDAVTLPTGAGPEQALAALRTVTDRHEAMRTTLRLHDGRLYQDIHPTVPVELPVTDLSALPGPERDAARARIVAEYARLDLPMDSAPLWRARLLRLDPDTWWLLFAGHHVILDGTSLLHLRAELTELCAAAVAGRAPDLPELPIQYADYAAWERDRLDGPRWDELRDHWREALTGLPAVHALTTDRPRPATLTFDGGYQAGFRIGAAYEIPEIALRVQLMYRSEVNHEADGTFTTALDGLDPPGPTPPFTTGTAVGTGTLPQSVELKVQSGIAPGWLAFGSVRWTDWSVLDTLDYTITGGPLPGVRELEYYFKDGWTVTGGIGHAFNENISGVVGLTWDRGVSTTEDTLSDTYTFAAGVSLKDKFGGEVRFGGALSYLTAASVAAETSQQVGVYNPGNSFAFSVDGDWVYALSAGYKIAW